MLSKIKNKVDVSKLFPASSQDIKSLTKKYMHAAKIKIDAIIAIEPEKRTFENTAKALDKVSSLDDISILYSSISALEMLSPKKEIRDAARESIVEIQTFWIHQISNNIALYQAFKTYALGNAKHENLNPQEQYFISETLKDFQRSGLDLPEEKLEKVKKLNKELGELCLSFESNIAEDTSHILVSEQELEGVNQSFIKTLEKAADDGKFILGVDYPTYFTIMNTCAIKETRKKLYLAFNNRAYPKNESILKKIIEKRDELAHFLGFKSFAHLDLDDQMAKNPETVEIFLTSLYEKSRNKAQAEFQLLCENLPQSIQLAPESKIYAWDMHYIKNAYKKKYLQIDEQNIAEYFPAENTISKLLTIYEQFLSLRFEISSIDDLWHKDTSLVEVYDSKNKMLGYLILDLHPREYKYSHACQITIVPAVKSYDPCVCIVVANFPKSTKEKPSLLKLNDVETFFHELGHALHAILGRTAIGSFSGTNVKTDFVEMPSQMFEEWLSDKEILQKISCHYKSSEHLPDETITNILKLKHFDSGDFLQRQCYLSYLALEFFKKGKNKNPKYIYQNLTNHMRPYIAYDQDDNMYASFGHLAGYGAKYYSYMWSKVFALDMFAEIKKYGLLNPRIGKKYIDEVIGKGASEDPNILLRNFLGRKPNDKAFFQNMGLL